MSQRAQTISDNTIVRPSVPTATHIQQCLLVRNGAHKGKQPVITRYQDIILIRTGRRPCSAAGAVRHQGQFRYNMSRPGVTPIFTERCDSLRYCPDSRRVTSPLLYCRSSKSNRIVGTSLYFIENLSGIRSRLLCITLYINARRCMNSSCAQFTTTFIQL